MLAKELFSLPTSLAHVAPWFDEDAHPWDWLKQINLALEGVLAGSDNLMSLENRPAGVYVRGPVFIHPTVRLPLAAVIEGPAWIGAHTEIRPGCFIRGNVIVGENCVLGNSCEYKNCLLMDDVETAHFNYVGDSILGTRAHLGAGAICANLKLNRDEVTIRIGESRFRTGLKKVGAFLGEGAEVGCNSVLQPGTVLGKNSAVISMPFHGYLPEGQMALPESKYRTLPRPE
ncbi:MAG: UDP-N-acetylglucosamine diphosphorylase [Opitutales bacterium]|nr:UDP-N-acetylglucosamine diphosphorylase [Opitutales bacterium]